MKTKKLLKLFGGVIILAMLVFVWVYNVMPYDMMTVNNFDYEEIVTGSIGKEGGTLTNRGGTISAIIPPLQKASEISLSFKKSSYEVVSGERSPITVNISPENFLDKESIIPIKIIVKLGGQYALPVPYLIDEKNKLHLAQLTQVDREKNIFTIETFRGGDFSWVYVPVRE
jgi:hypothetical protein